ncbi:equilibrative nucleoside transporter 1-like [Artemia franciscana]|uniref:equilibrative nucleoside transporter 1-like n=1 Tax=Artemia franciscana TaxID=6661 RepID=UPI0032DA5985
MESDRDPDIEKGTPPNGPSDKWKLLYLILLINGVGTLWVWNTVLMSENYFMDKLSGTDYGTGIVLKLMLVIQIPNFIIQWANVFFRFGKVRTFAITSLIAQLCIFIPTVVFAGIDSSGWKGAFYWSTLGLLLCLGMAVGFYQNTVFGIAAQLPQNYMGAVIIGNNISGTINSLVEIIFSAISPDNSAKAIFYFMSAVLVILLCLLTLVLLHNNRFYSHYRQEFKRRQKDEETVSGRKTQIQYWHVIKTCYPQCQNIFLIMFVTLTVFPAIQMNVASINSWMGKWFTQITCFLTFNLTAFLGALITSWVQWPGPEYLWIPVWLRILFIPIFLFCNYQPKGLTRTAPIFISIDWVYWIIGILFGLSQGYFSSLAMMYGPKTVKPEEQSTAGKFCGAFLISGIIAAIAFSFALPLIVS